MTYFPATLRPGGKSNRLTLAGRYIAIHHQPAGAVFNRSPVRDHLTFIACGSTHLGNGGAFITACRPSIRYNSSAMEFLKTIGGKIVTGLVALAVIAGADLVVRNGPGHAASDCCRDWPYSWLAWSGDRAAVGDVLPHWARGADGKQLAGALLVFGYTLIEAVLLAWLFSWSFTARPRYRSSVPAVLIAGAYNLFACDWIAEKVE